MLLQVPAFVDFQNALLTIIGIPHNTAPGQRAHFTAKEVQHGIHHSCHTHHHPEAVDLIEGWNCLLDSQCQVRDGVLAYKMKMLFESVTGIWCYLFCNQNNGVSNQGGSVNGSPQRYT